MLNPRVASRYAKSLLDLAIERGELETVYKDMLYMQQLTKGSKEFTSLLRSPVVKAEAKTRAVNAVFAGNVSPLTTSFTNLMIAKAREAVFPEIINAFVAQYKKYKNIYTVQLTTAEPVSDAVRDAILAQVRKTSNMDQIELETKINPDIIGGFVLQAGDKLVDASIAYDLKQISKQFDNNDFIYKVR
jgi:F-type H+-transporting ATPase subunit delta